MLQRPLPRFLGLVIKESVYCALQWGRLSPLWDNSQPEPSRSSGNRKLLIEGKCADSIVCVTSALLPEKRGI